MKEMSKPTTKPKLPKTLHAAWKLALDDFRSVVRSGKYEVQMGTWLEPTNSHCVGCVAGSILYRSFGKRVSCSPYVLGKAWGKVFCAVDDLRFGWIDQATGYMNRDSEKGRALRQRFYPMPRYQDNKRKWWKRANQLLVELKKAGL